MKSISPFAEDVQKNPTATRYNSPATAPRLTASIESGSRPGNTPDESGERTEKAIPGKLHSFSRKLARAIQAKKGKGAKHGAHEAILLKYLAHRVNESKNVVDGKKWCYITIDDLATRFPYLGHTTIYDLVLRLKKLGYIEVDNLNKHKYDRTFWYHVPEKVRDAGEEDLVYFDSMVAADVGVPAAVLWANFKYWIGQCEEHGVEKRVVMLPAKLSELLPFHRDTIKRALKDLVSEGWFQSVAGKQCWYGENITKNRGANPNKKGANPNDRGAYPNEKGANPNDDTPYITLGPLGNLFKRKACGFFFRTSFLWWK